MTPQTLHCWHKSDDQLLQDIGDTTPRRHMRCCYCVAEGVQTADRLPVKGHGPNNWQLRWNEVAQSGGATGCVSAEEKEALGGPKAPKLPDSVVAAASQALAEAPPA